MDAGASQLFVGDFFPGNGANDVGTGDEHLADAFDHGHEIGHGRGVDGAAGTRPDDGADLGHDAGEADIAEEDLAVAGQPFDPLLDAGAGRVVETDHRHPVASGQIHQLDQLFGERFAQ